MDKETFLEKIKEIGSCEDEVTRRSLLADLNDGVSGVFDENETLTQTNSELSADNDRLREVNNSLWQSYGTNKPNPQNETGLESGEKRKFENLFNNKGELI